MRLSIFSEAVISHNTWVHRIARVGVRPLVDTPVTPNHLTTLRLATGIGAACAFAVGTPGWRTAGIAMMVISLLLDRADGELARLSGRVSHAGHRYDLVADGLSNGAVFVGIGVGLVGSILGAWSILLGVLAGVAAVVGEMLLMRLETLGHISAAKIGGYWGFDPDDGMFAVPLAVAFGLDLPLLFAACVGASLVMLFFVTKLVRQQGSAAITKDS